MSLRTSDYQYTLPPELIAQYPGERRDASRMMVLHRSTGAIEHCVFSDLPRFFRPGDLAVLNNTRVLPARLLSEDGRMEILLLEHRGPCLWLCIGKPGKRLRAGMEFELAGTRGRVEEVLEGGERLVRFATEPDLETHGHIPLPHYMNRADAPSDRERYQTVYAAVPGAIAAPTAGLHFTPEILAKLSHTFVTLHVGVGTFRSVKVEDVRDHVMHEEWFSLPEETASRILTAQRVLAVGTTAVRVLESSATGPSNVAVGSGRTNIFIHPPHTFQITGAMLTNFHLPCSTLLMLVSAFAGREFVLHAYAEAVRERYRFFSYGDCMLLL